jgi:hypothetical protein
MRTYDKVTSGPLQAHYPKGTGHGPKGSRSPRERTNGVAHSLATDFAKPTGIQLFVRSSWRCFFSSLVPIPQKRSRPVSSVEEIDGREDATREEERVLLSDDDVERTLSDLHVPMEVEVVVAESSVRAVGREFHGWGNSSGLAYS